MKTSDNTNSVLVEGSTVDFLVTAAFKGELKDLAIPETDLLVMTHLQSTSFGPGTTALDELTDGLLLSRIEEADFQGKAGETLLVQTNTAGIKNILLIGLGKPLDVHRTTICSFYRMIIEHATKLGARKVSIPFFSGLLIDINYRGMLAVLRCRVDQSAQAGEIGELAQIEVLCNHQSKRHIVDGLSVDKTLCAVCRHPKFKTGE